MELIDIAIASVEQGWIPDAITRLAIRRLCRRRLVESHDSFIESLRSGAVAPVPDKANQQHYELPVRFFELMLGPHRKYSCCYFSTPTSSLAVAEDAALTITCEHASIQNGQRILELGCGWGSLSLWMATKYPDSRITAVSNSTRQREYIEQTCTDRQITNLEVVTADMNEFTPAQSNYDRVVSVEMFEHMHNYELLLQRIASWLHPEGKLFVHYFCHRQQAYPFLADGGANWMGRYFFTGGIMPSLDLLRHFPRDLRVSHQWHWNGMHYHRTAEAWLRQFDQHRDEIERIFVTCYGSDASRRWLHRWRMFLLAVSELFAMDQGNQWLVAHTLLDRIVVDRSAIQRS